MRFFIDSNIIIESFKENYNIQVFKLLSELLEFYRHGKIELCINIIVENEVIFILIVKGKAKFSLEELINFLDGFTFLNIEENIRKLYRKYINIYKLKPNDALILATCKHYDIPYLISLDADFIEPCEKEGIVLINSADKLKEILLSST